MAAVQKPPLGLHLHPAESSSLVFVSTCKLEEMPPPPLKAGLIGRAASLTQRCATARSLDRRLSGTDTSHGHSSLIGTAATAGNTKTQRQSPGVQVNSAAPSIVDELPAAAVSSGSQAPSSCSVVAEDEEQGTGSPAEPPAVMQKDTSYIGNRKLRTEPSPTKRRMSSRPKPKQKPKPKPKPKNASPSDGSVYYRSGKAKQSQQSNTLSAKPWIRSKSLPLSQTAPPALVQASSVSLSLQNSPISVLSPLSSRQSPSRSPSPSTTPPDCQQRRATDSDACASVCPIEPGRLELGCDAEDLPAELLPAAQTLRPLTPTPSEGSLATGKQRSSITGCPARVVAHLKGTKTRQESKPLAKSWPRTSSPVKKRPGELSPCCPPKQERNFDPEEAARKAAARLMAHKRLKQEQRMLADQEEARKRDIAKELRNQVQSERNNRRQRIYALNAILTQNEWANIQIVMKQMEALKQDSAVAEDAAEMIAAVATNSV